MRPLAVVVVGVALIGRVGIGSCAQVRQAIKPERVRIDNFPPPSNVAHCPSNSLVFFLLSFPCTFSTAIPHVMTMRHRRLVVGGAVVILLFCIIGVPFIVIFGRAKRTSPAAHLLAAVV
jgi:hypothetical protein